MSPIPGDDPDGVPLYRRSIEYEAFDRGDHLEVVGKLKDTRPWADDGSTLATVHDMELRVTVRRDDLTIVGSVAHMHTFPHTECPVIEQAFAGLVGLSVARGYTREVQRRFGGPRGCTHLEQLARSLGPLVIQAVTSRRARSMAEGGAEEVMMPGSTPWARDSCHIWAEGGVGDQKLAAGWRPGRGEYPALSVEAIRREGDVS